VAAAFVVPYFFYRSTDVLEIPRSELNDLTSTARDAIEAGQRHVSDVQPYILPLSGVLIFGGAGFLGYRLNRSLDPLGVATVIREDEIPRLPRAFIEAFSD
jgi:hypothetical protein